MSGQEIAGRRPARGRPEKRRRLIKLTSVVMFCAAVVLSLNFPPPPKPYGGEETVQAAGIVKNAGEITLCAAAQIRSGRAFSSGHAFDPGRAFNPMHAFDPGRNASADDCPPDDADMRIALTFDDGPHPRYTPRILEILGEYGVRATFFIIGKHAEWYPELVGEELSAGHEIGNHTFSHKMLGNASRIQFTDELTRCEAVIKNISGDYRPRLFRPPGGQMGNSSLAYTHELDYEVVMWSIDTKDWEHLPSKRIAERVLAKVKAGDIILMHDFIGQNSPTPEALRLIIPALQERGFEFVTVSELLEGRESG